MNAVTHKGAIKTLSTQYVDGAFVESHGREVMDIINPTNGKAIGRVTLADEEDTQRAIAAAKRAFVTFGRSTKEERVDILRVADAGADRGSARGQAAKGPSQRRHGTGGMSSAPSSCAIPAWTKSHSRAPRPWANRLCAMAPRR